MNARAGSNLGELNWSLLMLMVILLGMGLVMLTTASISVAENNFGEPFYYLKEQLLAVVLGLMVGAVMLRAPTELWERLSPFLLGLALLMLVAVLIPGVGREVNGSSRWIGFGGINFQVSEPARLLVLMYIASYAVRHRDDIGASVGGFLRPMLVVFIVGALLMLEPDFGATVVMLLICMSVLFVAGVPWRYFGTLIVALALMLGALIAAAPYRLRRFTGFTNPWEDPYGSGFQLSQSLIAIGSGEWFGAGLGNSVQKLFYLPEAHTDFVFAVIAEEFGLVGTIVLICTFGLLVWSALRIASAAVDRERFFQAYLAFGIAVWLCAQVLINLGVNMGILPTKGLTLPLVSYGRSSLIITIAALALLLRIDMENRAGETRAKGGRK